MKVWYTFTSKTIWYVIKRMITSGMLSFAEITKRMNEASELKEGSEKLREQKEKLMQEILKEFFE